MILGIDEVGRGPWAGPLVIGAVVLGDVAIEGLTDSKKLTKKRREELDPLIRSQAAGFGLGWVHSDEIDRIGLSEALKLATIRAVEQVKATYHEIMIDGTINFLKETSKGSFVTTLPKGDLLIPSISAASIIAKVARDNYMAEQDALYPGYGFKSHVGYGTAAHKLAIEKLGVTPLHRRSFAPIAEMVAPIKTTTQIGNAAEAVVADYLADNGHRILERNWKTKFCEIDIISVKNDTVYFTEVKYRRTSWRGDGMAAIIPSKLKQMKFAAEFYSVQKKLEGRNLKLAVASLSGDNHLDTFLEIE
jgi:ribonuclease HII